MKKIVLLVVLALLMSFFVSCISNESAYNLGYSAGYLGAELSS